MNAILPTEEEERLEELDSYQILDTEPEDEFDELTRLAATICEAPYALISLVGRDRQWFKSRFNLKLTETPREFSFCAHAIRGDDLWMIPDLLADVRFSENPYVTNDPNVRFYAGAHLLTPQRRSLGTICVMDIVPRTLTDSQQEALRVLSRVVMAKLESRRKKLQPPDNGEQASIVEPPQDCGSEAQALGEAREALYLSEERFRFALDSAELGTWDIFLKNRQLTWDERTRRQCGVVEESTNLRAALQIIHPADRRRVIRAGLQAIREEPGIIYTEYRVIWPDQSIHWITSHGRVLFAPTERGRQPVRITGVNRDITQRQTIGSALQLKSELLTAVSKSLELFLEQGDWNKALAQLLRCALQNTGSGYGFIGVLTGQKSELRVLAAEELLENPTTSTEFQKKAEAAFQSQGYFVLDRTFFNELISLGETFFENGTLHQKYGPLPTGFPELQTYLAVPIRRGSDVVGLIVLANSANGYSDGTLTTLAMLVQQAGVLCDSYRHNERSKILKHDHEILELQLRQSQKLEAIGQLAGGVAHDFNNLLTVITGHSELMLMQYPISSPQRDSLLQIATAGERAAQLTRQLLTFSRRQLFQPKPVEINPIIQDIVKMLSRMIPENVQIRCELGTSLPRLLADTGMIEQVVMNLVVNARDAMRDGGEIVIRTGTCIIDGLSCQLKLRAKLGQSVWVSVEDTGCGISSENLSHIFEPFYTTKGVGEGTGLGLATVYGIVEQHGGWVEVESVVDVGTKFTVLIPATKESEVEGSQDHLLAPGGGHETILLVEDEEFVRALARQILEENGYRVLEAENGHEALEIWQANEKDIALLLTDMVMPGKLSGRDVADNLRKKQPNLPVVYSSGYSQELLKFGLELSKGIGYLPKPYRPQDLIRVVRETLDAIVPA